MRFHHIAATVLVVTLVGFVGCRKDRAGVTYYPVPPAAVTVVPQPPPPPEYAPAPAPGQPHAPPPPEYVPAPPLGTSPAAPAAGSMTQPAAGSTTQDSMAPEVLTRGPLHEAFAEPVTYNPQPGLVAPRQPPAVVEEMPPDEQPQGAVWIPGYWAWDDDRSDFLWVSGIWRVPPPNCGWVPGYWTQVAGGWQWTSGFWMANQTREITYLPTPPASLELGPSSPPPSDNYIWATGCWNWSSGRYLWRPGYWMVAQPSWVWVSAHYIWTPRGYVFAGGYWDYTLENRGLVFAPVYFQPAVYAAPIYYSPVVVIDTGLLSFNLFTQPRYCRYYFGDYYAVGYTQAGIYPWYAHNHYRLWYDPIYQHRRWNSRNDDPRWSERLREQYQHLRDTPAARPPRTFAAEQALLAKAHGIGVPQKLMARPLAEVVASKNTEMKFEKLDRNKRQEIAKYSNELEKYKGQRAAWETPPGAPKPTASTSAKPPQGPVKAAENRPPATLPSGPMAGRPPIVPPTAPTGIKPPTTGRTQAGPPMAPVMPPNVPRTPAVPTLPSTGPRPPTAPVMPPNGPKTPAVPTLPSTGPRPPTVVTPPTREVGKTPAPPTSGIRTPLPPTVREIRIPQPPTVVTPPTREVGKTPAPPTSGIRTPLPPTVQEIRIPQPPVVQPRDIRGPVQPTGPSQIVRPPEVREPVRVRVPTPPIVRPPVDTRSREMQPPPRPDTPQAPTFRPPGPEAGPAQPRGRP